MRKDTTVLSDHPNLFVQISVYSFGLPIKGQKLACYVLYLCGKYFTDMQIYKTYIQQITFDGSSYPSDKRGSIVDLLEKFKITCQEFPFKKNPKPKDLPTRDWAGEDGLDVYVPDVIPISSYEIEVKFLYVGTEQTIRKDLSDFIDFLYGRIKGNDMDTVQSGRLAVYDEHVGMGRKDVVVSEVENTLYYLEPDTDNDAIATFKVTFKVYDPTTDVTPTYGTYNGVTILTGLTIVGE